MEAVHGIIGNLGFKGKASVTKHDFIPIHGWAYDMLGKVQQGNAEVGPCGGIGQDVVDQ